MKWLISLPLAAMLFTGCSFTKVTDGTFSATRITLGNNIAIGKLQAAHGTNSIALEQYSNNQTEALGVIAKGLAEGAVKGAKPGP